MRNISQSLSAGVRLRCSASSLRILILNQFFHPDVSATSQLMTDLGEDLVARGMEVTVLASNRPYLGGEVFSRREQYRGVEVIRVSTAPFTRRSVLGRVLSYLTFYASAFFRLLVLPRQDIILVLTTPPLIGLIALLVKALRGTRLVYLVQDLYPDVAIVLGLLRPKSLLTRILESLSRKILCRSDACIVLGECVASRIREKGVSPDRIAVLQNWADSEIRPMAMTPNPFRSSYTLENKFVVQYSGNFGRAHDFSAVVGAIQRLASTPEVLFLFIGDGPRREELASELNARENVRFLPYQPRKELSRSLGAADASLVLLADGLAGMVVPSKLYGVMASGRPVLYVGPESGEAALTVRRFDCGFVLRNGDAGALANAISILRSKPEMARAMGERARAAYEANFRRELITARYHDVLQTVGQGRRLGDRTSAHLPAGH